MIGLTISDALNRLGVREKCESPSLRLSKYLKIGKEGENATKRAEVDAVVECAKSHAQPVSSLQFLNGERIIAQLRSRLIVNQAGGILENAGLCLHRHFGYPYIPGSAVKGLARHAAWCEWKAEKDTDAKLEIAQRIAKVFGYPTGDKAEEGLDKSLEGRVNEQSGSVCFMAAEPIGEAPLVADIVTCHHPKYYQGSLNKATDTENPIPNPFPAVEKGAKFQFQIIPLRNSTQEQLEDAKNWLIKAITVYGIGAKTAAGYGWFKDVTAEHLKAEEDNEKRERIKKAREILSNELEIFATSVGDVMTVDEIAQYQHFKELAEGIEEQKIKDTLNKLKDRLPKETEESKLRRQWTSMKEDKLLKSLKDFHKIKDASKKEAIVQLLKTDFSHIYKKIKSGVKGFPGDAQRAINEAMKGGVK